MSLWLSETKTTGLWKGGLWKSQQGSPYAFNLDLSTFTDTVTGQSLSCNIDGTRYDKVNGVTTAFGTDVPTIADNGLRICGAYSNLLKYSENFASWNTTYCPNNDGVLFTTDETNGVYSRIVSNIITISGVVAFHLSTKIKAITQTQFQTLIAELPYKEQSNIITKLAAEQTITIQQPFNTSGSQSTFTNINYICKNLALHPATIQPLKSQLSQKKYAHPYIPTTTEAVSSPSEAGNSGTGVGIWIDDVATNFPLLNTALTSQGTLTFKWKTGFNDAAVSGNLNILSFNGTTTSAISYDADNNLIKITDGTNTASKALTVVADTEYTIQATWGLVSGSPKMAIAVNGIAGTQADFTGTFNPSDVYFGLGNEELQYICKNPDGHDLTVLKVATWL